MGGLEGGGEEGEGVGVPVELFVADVALVVAVASFDLIDNVLLVGVDVVDYGDVGCAVEASCFGSEECWLLQLGPRVGVEQVAFG